MKRIKYYGLYIIVVLIMVGLFQKFTVTVDAYKSLTYAHGQKELVQVVHNRLAKWETEFTVTYKGDIDKVFPNGEISPLFKKVFLINDKKTSDDYDYLKHSVSHYQVSYTTYSKTTKIKFQITYLETLKQHQKVNAFANAAVKKLNLKGKSDYKKVKRIHDYIINRVSYDESCHKYSAYNAAIQKSAVCQGYALLFYKMATKAGVPTRCIESKDHIWNMVKVEGKWYYIDLTWDDPISYKPVVRYRFFLKGSKTMSKTHHPIAEYKSSAFKKRFPLSKSNYKKKK